ncbi:hypothetical protein SLS55_010429 [Diplodia seriata]|uniref:Heterokaryon incompatibility domain-containing protein n=1 Tax=Diplodia seriata TaxID=420778 RepID=A0ABR3BYH6_9PEZI
MQIKYNRNSHDDDCFIFEGFKSYVRFSAQPDSPAAASAKVYSGPTISSSASPESFTNINILLSGCIEHHAECRNTLGGTPVDDHSQPPTLPTYILDVGHSNPPSPSIRLVEAEPGQRGHYAALSYCWGPSPAHHPPTTTSANLASHTAGIPLSTLPKTFQDAVTATRELGLRHLWIDTLCTVQPTTTSSQAAPHRASTARTARTAYSLAQIVLAAASAATPTAGLFRQYPPRTFATVPYLDGAGHAAGTMRAELRPSPRALSPEHGALNDCAWATAPLVLARRVAYFTAGAVVWSCRRLRRTARWDDGVLDYFAAARPTDWARVVTAHSTRALAVPGERLEALEGVVEELALARRRKSGGGGEVQCVFGVWTDALATQLMWGRIGAPGSLSRPSALAEVAPSWSWASTEGGVSMMEEEQWRGGGDGGLEVRAQLAIDDGGGDKRRIRARGKLGRVELRVIEKLDPYLHPCDCEVRSLDGDDDFVGLAASDVGLGEGVMTAVVWCLVVLFHPYNCPGGSYLALFLRPREHGSDHYERIGHGMVVKKEWADRLVESQLYLV